MHRFGVRVYGSTHSSVCSVYAVCENGGRVYAAREHGGHVRVASEGGGCAACECEECGDGMKGIPGSSCRKSSNHNCTRNYHRSLVCARAYHCWRHRVCQRTCPLGASPRLSDVRRPVARA